MIVKFIREIILFLFVSGLSRLLPFLLTPIFTHHFLPQEMGRLELILAVYNIVMIFGMCQLDTSVQRYFYLDESVVKSAIIGVVKLSSIITMVFFLCIPLTTRLLSLGSSAYIELLIAGASILFANLHVINGLVLRYSKPVKYVVIVNTMQTTLFAVLAYIAVVKLNLGAKGYLSALLVSYLIATFVSIIMIRDKLIAVINKSHSAKIWEFALPQMPARIASAIAQYGNRFVLLTIFTQTTIGIFGIANKISTLMLVGLSAFCMVWYPMLYSKKVEQKDIARLFKIVILLLPVVVLVITLLSVVIFRFYISKQYASGELAACIMIVAASLLIIKEMVDAGIKLSEKVKYISYIYIGNTIFLFALIIVNGLLWGVTGVAYAMLVANITLVYVTWFIAEKLHPMNFDLRYCHIYILFCLILTFILTRYI